MMSRVHLIDAQRSVASDVAVASLLAHAIGHEEGLVGLLSAEPKWIKVLSIYLHSVHPLGGRL